MITAEINTFKKYFGKNFYDNINNKNIMIPRNRICVEAIKFVRNLF